MKTIHLHGELGKKYGEKYVLNVSSVPETIRALGYQLNGFIQDIYEGEFTILRGDESIGEDYIELPFGRINEIHIIPVPVGSKSGLGKIILGTLLIAAAFAFAPVAIAGAGALGPLGSGVAAGGVGGLGATAFAGVSFGQIVAFGGLIALSGAATLLSPTPEVGNFDTQEPADQRSSFLFNNKPNQSRQGGSVQVAYGKIRTGVTLLVAGLDVTQLSLEDILDTEITDISSHLVTTRAIIVGSPGWAIIGYSREYPGSPIDSSRDGIPDPRQGMGEMIPLVFRNRGVWQCFQWRDNVIGDWHMTISIEGVDHPRDFFDILEIENPPGTVVRTLGSATANTLEPRHTLRYQNPITGNTVGIGTTMWDWNIASSDLTGEINIVIGLKY